MKLPIRGSCLCGSVKFMIDGPFGPVGQCHCSKCRKVSGTDGNAVFYTSAKSFHWLVGEDAIKVFELADSNGWRSSFCETCGSPVPHTDNSAKMYFVPAGLLDDDPEFRGFAAHIHVESKAPWVRITDDAPQYSEGFGSPAVSG